jgi:predicted O-methyltransferase YrrM
MNEALLSLLEKLAKLGENNDARETERPKRMLNITPDTGRFLWILVRTMGATRILEVGTSNAFSTIWLADAARSTGGRVTTLEQNPNKIALARANLAAAHLEEVVEIVQGRAAETLPTLPGPFDIVFLDADRLNYLAYLELVVPKLRIGGLLIADNATSHPDEMRDYFARLQSHPQMFAVTVPIGNGELIAFKLEKPT